MHYNLMLLALAPQASFDHAALHPRQAFIYLEAPDVDATLKAYDHAPLVQMVRDEKVRSSVYGLLESWDIDLDEKFAELGAKLGLPEEKRAAPISGMIDYLRYAKSASFSLGATQTHDGVAMNLFGKSIGSLTAIQAEITKFESKHNGEPPASLDDLHLSPSVKNDPWGHPFVYLRASDGRSYDLRSLGADGKEGGEGANADIVAGHVSEATERMIAGLADQLSGLVVVRFSDANGAQAAHTALRQLAERAGLAAPTVSQATYLGQKGTLEQWAKLGNEAFPVWMISTDQTIAIGAGALKASDAVALAEGKGEPVAKVAHYGEMLSKMSPAAGTTLLRGYMHNEGLMQFVYEGGQTTEALRQLIERSGGEGAMRMQLVDDHFLTELVSTPSSKDYFGKSMGQKSIPPETWKYIPEDAVAFWSTSVDGAALYKELLLTLHAEQQVADLDAHIKELEEKHGINLERDLFQNLGGGVVAYLLPITGPSIGIGLIVDLKDAAAFTKGTTALMNLLGEQNKGEFSVTYKPYRYKDVDYPKWSFSFGSENGQQPLGGMMLPSPTIAIVQNRAVLTMYSVRATKEIKRIVDGDGAPHPVLKDSRKPPAEACSIVYFDMAGLFGGIYKAALSFASLAGGKFDVSKFPDAATFTHFFKPMIGYSKLIEGGSYAHIECSFGPETAAFFVGGVAAAVLASREADQPVAQVPTDEEDAPSAPKSPAPPKEIQSIEKSKSIEALARISTAIAVYKVDHGKLPATLDDLTKSSPNFPKGFLNGAPVPADGWGHALAYVIGADGKSFTLWSFGPDGVDQKGAGDDVQLR